MNYSKHITHALQNDPPGEWMPTLPDQCIRLSSGFPSKELVPVKEINKATSKLLDEEQDLPLHYLGTPKLDAIKEQLIHRLEKRDLRANSNQLLVTAGACQAIDLIARIFLDEETLVVVEDPTYMEALEIFRNYTNRLICIPVDEKGLRTDKLEEFLEMRQSQGQSLPRFVYTIPTFQNPTGTTMPLARRRHLLALASHYDFHILEDDAYGELYFNKELPTLKSLDKENRVLYVGSLSKVVAPGLRIGYIVATEELITSLYWFKKDLDHPFTQAIMSTYLANNDQQTHLEILRKAYMQKRDCMIKSLNEHMPSIVHWIVPEGGYFVWVEVQGIDTNQLLQDALDRGVAYLPGRYFFLNPNNGKHYLRLSFSYASMEEIETGVKLLADLIKEKKQNL
ncbi:PLP-dependent aminotransferase family protein [Gracilibacillus marinus]|uniref:PLP-dependent aminotransferase family protein n=1 Tax=Gracilibacillus marinus TaxID=630535 RepID=A0ABV8VUA1_9BACI